MGLRDGRSHARRLRGKEARVSRSLVDNGRVGKDEGIARTVLEIENESPTVTARAESALDMSVWRHIEYFAGHDIPSGVLNVEAQTGPIRGPGEAGNAG